MKLAFTNNEKIYTAGKKTANRDWKAGLLPPPILLQRTEPAALRKDDYLTMKLRLLLTKEKSPTYNLVVPYFSKGTPEEWLKFLKNIDRVFVG